MLVTVRRDARKTPADEAAVAPPNVISICICTYCRPGRLTLLLDHLKAQREPPAVVELVIVDNDAGGSAREIVSGAHLVWPVQYDVEPIKNISLARNRAVALARGDWIAFVDDDEMPQEAWLSQLHATAVRCGADGVMGPVVSVVPATAPGWIRRGDFFIRPRHVTGAQVPPNELRMGNALVDSSWLRRFDGPFDPAYGLTGGEDSDLLMRIADAGARFVWCDEAVVFEPVAPERLCVAWLLRRAHRGGQGWARHARASHYNSTGLVGGFLFVVRAAVAMGVAVGFTVGALPFGRRRWIGWLCKATAQMGKLTALAGHRDARCG